jgi:hypothetical protein
MASRLSTAVTPARGGVGREPPGAQPLGGHEPYGKAGRARLDALEKGGVEIADDGVRLIKKPRR